MSRKSDRIFRDKFADLSEAISEPGPIADSLFQAGVIGKPSRDRATQNNVPAFERTSTLLSAVLNMIKSDFNKPDIFIKTINVLKGFAETVGCARQMESEFYGTVPPESHPAPLPPVNSIGIKKSVSFTIGDEETDAPPSTSPVPLEERPSVEPYNNQLPKEPDDQTVRASFSNAALGSVNVTVPLQGFFDWSYRHPKLTTFITVALVAVAGYSIYKYVTKK